MMLDLKLVLFCLLAGFQVEAVTFANVRIINEYVTGTNPTAIRFGCSFSSALSATDTVKLVTSTPLFQVSQTSGFVIDVLDNTWVKDTSKTVSATTDANGNVELTLAAGVSLTSGQVWYFKVIGNAVAPLPAAATVTAYVQATGLTDSAAAPGVNALDFIAAPTITLAGSANANVGAGTTPGGAGLVINFDMPYDTADATGKIKVTGSQAIFGLTQTSGLTQSGMTISGYTSSSDGLELEIDYTATISRGQAIALVVSGALLGDVPSVNLPVTIDIKDYPSGEAANHVLIYQATGYGTVINGVAAGSDPVARFGDRELEFQLPPRVLTPLLQTPDIKVFGSVFEGGNADEQWFDRIVLTTPQEDRFLQVKMKQNLQDVNRSKVAAKVFHTMDVTLGHGSVEAPSALTVVPTIDSKVPVHFLGHETVFRRVRRQATVSFTNIGSLNRECVDLAGSWMHFYVCSAPAAEYWGHQRDLSLKYAHLDLLFVEVIDFSKLTGLLPELWGVQEMTETTRSYVKNETAIAKSPNASKAAQAGGMGVEDLEKCIEQGSENFASDITITV